MYRTLATYLVIDQRGALLPITVEAKLRSSEVPRQGERLVVAYDPSDPTHVLILQSESEYQESLRNYVKQAVHSGNEAPCQVVALRQTGRVSRPKGFKPRRGPEIPPASPAPEVFLTLRVAPPGAAPFDVSRFLWDRDLGLAPGSLGTLFYLDGQAEHGYPVFPEARHHAGGDPVRAARDEFVTSLTPQTTVMYGGKLTITRGG